MTPRATATPRRTITTPRTHRTQDDLLTRIKALERENTLLKQQQLKDQLEVSNCHHKVAALEKTLNNFMDETKLMLLQVASET